MYRPERISRIPPMTSKILWNLLSPDKFSSQPTAIAPSMIGIARPKANANSSATPKTGEPMPAATPSNTISAGVQNGQIATENGTPSAKAPHGPVTGLARNFSAGSGRRSHPGQIRPNTISSGPSTKPQARPRSEEHTSELQSQSNLLF